MNTLRMPPTLLRFAQVLMLLALFAASGGQWIAWQSVAWTRMLVVYSQGGHVMTAVARTFDGRHPCALCKKIARAKSAESQSDRAAQQAGQDGFVAPPEMAIVKPEGDSWKMENPWLRALLRSTQPIAPPPRSAAV